MPTINSPLRYPGGKAVLTKFLAQIIEINGLRDGIYAEPYAGGAGAALNLLFAEHVGHIFINDADQRIYAFWKTVLERPNQFSKLIEEAPITLDQWHKQREIYRNPRKYSKIKVGFATFFLNRCNRSGILMNGGPIGGHSQIGNWKLDARFNKETLLNRIKKLSLYKSRISVSNLDAIDFLVNIGDREDAKKSFVYLDPPYYVKGSKLYLNHYHHDDHAFLANFIKNNKKMKWVMSYDNCSEINKLYSGMGRIEFNLNYSANDAKVGKELLIYDKNELMLPSNLSALKLVS